MAYKYEVYREIADAVKNLPGLDELLEKACADIQYGISIVDYRGTVSRMVSLLRDYGFVVTKVEAEDYWFRIWSQDTSLVYVDDRKSGIQVNMDPILEDIMGAEEYFRNLKAQREAHG